tara:strand:+ start:585 stop:1007 length:423 start_codon:yes stop_codon:yes gene_type:complete
MNGAYTPSLMKKMQHAITKKYSQGALKKMQENVSVVGSNRVLMKNGENGDNKKPEGVFNEAFRAPVTTRQYPTITAQDSMNIRGASEYLTSSDKIRQQILDNSNSSATVEQADSYRLNQLKDLSKKYSLDAVKGVINNKK